MKFTVSGLRGRVDEDLTPEVISRYSSAFASLFEPTSLTVARDTRESGEAISRMVSASFMWLGHVIHDFGVVPTPVFLRLIRLTRSSGGIMVSASHNPPRWNALKFAFGDRLSRQEEVELIARNLNTPHVARGKFGKYYESSARVYDLYLNTLGDLRYDLRGLKVVVDSQNGATAGWVARLLNDLGADVLPIRNLHGPLPEDPEPKRERFVAMDLLLRSGDYDVGFGYDPDGDRVIVGLKGAGMLTEEQTTALALYAATRYLNVGKVAVLNYSTSVLSEKVLKDAGLEVVRYKVGEPNVIQRLEELGGVLGGEGNGGLIYLPFSKGRDGVLSALLISRLVREGEVPEWIVRSAPNIGKEKLSLPVEEVVKAFEGVVSGWDLDRTDGYYFRRGNDWLHIRPSNTEPVVRVIWEGEEGFFSEVKGRVERLKGGGL